jgi:Ca2+-binding RTX toxin-like protein
MRHRNLFRTVGLAFLLIVLAVAPASAQGDPAPRITNDNFANAWAIGTGSGVSSHTNVGATTQTGEQLVCGLATMAATAWYSMTVSANSSVVVDTQGSTFDTILAVYTGGSLATLFQVNCNDDISGTDTDSSLQFSAVPGTTYWIQVGGWAGETGTYNVNIARTPTGPAAPTNDNFANAWAIGTGSGVSGHTNVGATTQTGEQLVCGPATMGATVWYSMTVSANSSVTVDTQGADFDTILAVYTGSSLGSLSRVTCNDDIGGGDHTSSVNFSAVPGTTYWIQVGGYGGAAGLFNLNVARTPTGPSAPSNDNFANAWPAGTTPSWTQPTAAATTQANEWLACGTSTMGATVWYSMTVAANSSVTVDTRGSSFDTILSVYTGSTLATLSRVACHDDISGTDYDSSVTFSAVPGITYWIQIGGYGGEVGTLTLNIARTGTATPLCGGLPATILGTAGNDTIYGTPGNDVIVARGGNDLIYGYGGNDRICGGPGNDYIYGGAGNDRLYGQGGNDYLYGQGGNDSLFGGPAYDVLRGGPGTDTCQTGEDVIC